MNFHKLMKQVIIVFLVFQSALAASQTMTEKIITVNPHLAFQNYEHFKRLTIDSPDSHAEFIGGFDFGWGYTYKLRVKETKMDEMLSDGSQYEYDLIEVVSKTKEPDSAFFLFTIDPNIYYNDPWPGEEEDHESLKPLNDSVFVYFDEIEIEVPKHLQECFQKIMESGNPKRGKFVYVNEKRIRLVATFS